MSAVKGGGMGMAVASHGAAKTNGAMAAARMPIASVGLAGGVEAVQSLDAPASGGPLNGADARGPVHHEAEGGRGGARTAGSSSTSQALNGAGMSKTAKDAGAARDQDKSSAEQRSGGRRLSYDLQVGVANRHRLFVGLTSNISSGGLFVSTSEPLNRGDRLEVRFRIPGSDHVFQKQAEVAWIRPIDESLTDATEQAGAGVRLLDLSEDEKRMLNAFIDVHDPLFFDM